MSQQSIAQRYEQDHARLDKLFKEFRTTKRSNGATAESTYRQFATGLTRHILWEEHILFPLFDAKAGTAGQGPTAVMRMEHRQIIQLLEAILHKLEHRDVAEGGEEAALTELLEAHNQKEEHILYPLIDECLSDDERQAVFTKMDQITADGQTPCCPSCESGEPGCP